MSGLVFIGNSFPSGFKMPAIIQREPERIRYRYLEFYTVRLRSYNTRMAYYRAINQFFHWIALHDATLSLSQVNSIMVATYVEEHGGAYPSRNQHLSALRSLFDWLIHGGCLSHNPAKEVRGFKHTVKRGKTPILSDHEVSQQLDSIDLKQTIGLRDRSIIATLFFSFARISAVLKMNVQDYFLISSRYWFRLHEKGGQYHEVPVHPYAQACLASYLKQTKLWQASTAPLFQTLPGRRTTVAYQDKCRRLSLAVASSMSC